MSSLRQNDSKSVTVEDFFSYRFLVLVKVNRSFLLYLFQKKDMYAISSYCNSWSNESSLKNIALYYCGYINTATLLHSYSVTCNFEAPVTSPK